MMNPKYNFARMRELLKEYMPSAALDQATIKLQECQFWLEQCTPTSEALERDQMAPPPEGFQRPLPRGPMVEGGFVDEWTEPVLKREEILQQVVPPHPYIGPTHKSQSVPGEVSSPSDPYAGDLSSPPRDKE